MSDMITVKKKHFNTMIRRQQLNRYLGIIVVIVACLCSQAFAASVSTDLIVDTEFVMDKIGKPGWVLVDMRVVEDFGKGHLPGAVGLPEWVSKAFADDTKRQLLSVTRMEKTLGEMGIGSDSNIIVYGDPKHVSWNAVMFWALELFGCNSKLKKCTVQYYDGGIERWKAEGGTLDQAETKLKPATFKSVDGTNRGVKGEEILQIVKSKETIIIDVRTPNEYKGLDVRALRGGHIPGAINIDFAKNFDAETFRMLPLEQLQGIYKNVPRSSRVIVHCQTGQRASYAYLVLRALGYENAANYHDGWRVYGSDLRFPVEDETWYDFNKVNSTIKAVNKMQEKVN